MPTPAAGGGGSFGAPPPDNPFADSAQPWSEKKGSINPYASPAGGFNEPKAISGSLGHQIVEIGPILNYSVRVWQNKLGLLVGITFVGGLIVGGVNLGAGIALGLVTAMGEPAVAIVVGLVVQLAAFLVAVFIGAGQTNVYLKVARGLQAEFGDLFSGGQRFPQVAGFMLLVYGPNIFLQTINPIVQAPLAVGGLLIVWSLAFLILGFICWPAYYLVLENHATVLSSFPLAAQITASNRIHSFLMFLAITGIGILGALACLVGLLFAIPLTQLILATAYLMMSAQLSTMPGSAGDYSQS
jgi:hypothetical protein